MWHAKHTQNSNMRLNKADVIKAVIHLLVFQCGVSYSEMHYGKIIGGENAAYGEFPYQLSVENYYPDIDFYSPFCGASAISDSWALSAAHCMFEEKHVISPKEVILRSGTLEKGENGTVHLVEKIIVHHKYDEVKPSEAQLDADISLLKVKNKFSTNPYVNYVRLPRQGMHLKAGTSVTAVGWGMIDAEMSESSALLKKTVLWILDRKTCQDMPHFRWEARISKNMICAAASETDTAPGDSGGPLVTVDGARHTQVGIVSWGSGTGQLDDPGIYTKVSVFRIWIHIKSGV